MNNQTHSYSPSPWTVEEKGLIFGPFGLTWRRALLLVAIPVLLSLLSCSSPQHPLEASAIEPELRSLCLDHQQIAEELEGSVLPAINNALLAIESGNNPKPVLEDLKRLVEERMEKMKFTKNGCDLMLLLVDTAIGKKIQPTQEDVLR